MIICVCNNLDEKKIQKLKEEFPTGYLAVLAKRSECGACVKYLKKDLKKCRSCDIIKEELEENT